MNNFISEEDFINLEQDLMDNYPEKIMYYEPKIERTVMAWYNPETEEVSKTYIVSEGRDRDGREVIIKYSTKENGPMQGIENIHDFKDQAQYLAEIIDSNGITRYH